MTDSLTDFPHFDESFSFLNRFILALEKDYRKRRITSLNELDEKVKVFFSAERMDEMESLVPHWQKMASYLEGVTLTHVMCCFLGMYMTREFLALTLEEQQIMKWVILFHDVEKEPQTGKRDHLHAFRSAASAARRLPDLGFPVALDYDSASNQWDSFTRSASTKLANSADEVQDNEKLPEILMGIERMFGRHTPADLVIRTILLHLSVNMKEWPPPNPLNHEQVKSCIDPELLPLLRVMNLADNDGWTLFDPSVNQRQRLDVLEEFEKIESLIS
jgi:hypothetical protein